jgi:hypothetical protein
VLGRLRGARVTLPTVIERYPPEELCHSGGGRFVSARSWPPTPWMGTVTAPTLPSPLEIQRRVAQEIGKASYSWPPAHLLPMLPHEGTERLVNRCLLRRVLADLGFLS